MSNSINPIDKEYIKALFPKYLLEQPIVNELCANYFEHRRLFRKLHQRMLSQGKGNISNHNEQDILIEANIINGEYLKENNGSQGLSVDLRREIWSNLMSAGVLGTVPYDSANDDYLIQVYKYFYPNDIRIADYPRHFLSTPDINEETSQIRTGIGASDSKSNSDPSSEVDTSNNNDKNTLDNENSDLIGSDIYSTMGYELPTRWLPQPNNALIISNDWSSKICVNPNWKNPLALAKKMNIGPNGSNNGTAFSYNRNRVRNNTITGNTRTNETNGSGENNKNGSTNDYIMTWSNNNLSSQKLAIFYYEVKVLSVSSSEGGKNSNIIVGFKYSRIASNDIDNGNELVIKDPNLMRNDNVMMEPNPLTFSGDHTTRTRNRERRRRNRINEARRRRRSSGGNGGSSATQGQNNDSDNASIIGIRNETIISTNTEANDNDDGNNNNTTNNDNEGDSNSNEDDDNDDDNTNDESDDNDNDLDITSGAHRGTSPELALRRGTRRSTAAANDGNSRNKHLKQMLSGMDDTFFGYNGFDGNAFSISESEPFAKSFGINDIIGCGINYINGTIFFTKNGVLLGTAFSEFHDINLVPAIALKVGNSVQTNFGLLEEFSFNISGYQNKWKSRAYSHIFNSISNEGSNSLFKNDNNKSGTSSRSQDKEGDIDMYGDENENENENNTPNKEIEILPFLLQKDNRFNKDGQLMKLQPNSVPINNLNSEDESVPSTLNCLVNGYLIHEGLIDVAKGFLKDLQNEIEPENKHQNKINDVDCDTSYDPTPNDENTAIQKQILQYNEKLIIKEENMLQIRQEMRKLINARQVSKCIDFIHSQIPGFLESNADTLFELKLAHFLINIENNTTNINELVSEGQELTEIFVYNRDNQYSIDKKRAESFQERIGRVSSLLAYNSPKTEAPEELLLYFTKEYLQDRLFQTINSNVLIYINQTDENALENIVGYTRTMLSTMRRYHIEGDHCFEEDPELGLQISKSSEQGTEGPADDTELDAQLETRYYKIINLDEDILNL